MATARSRYQRAGFNGRDSDNRWVEYFTNTVEKMSLVKGAHGRIRIIETVNVGKGWLG